MFAKLGKWAVVLLIVYLLGGVASCGTLVLIDQYTKPSDLLAKLHSGMTPAEVEAIVSRPSEYRHDFGCVPDCGPFSHNWTVAGHRVEVIFDRSGHATEIFAYSREWGPVARFVGRTFFWWLLGSD